VIRIGTGTRGIEFRFNLFVEIEVFETPVFPRRGDFSRRDARFFKVLLRKYTWNFEKFIAILPPPVMLSAVVN
jgi:hypothetical protein